MLRFMHGQRLTGAAAPKRNKDYSVSKFYIYFPFELNAILRNIRLHVMLRHEQYLRKEYVVDIPQKLLMKCGGEGPWGH
jgi:hypothetical protein